MNAMKMLIALVILCSTLASAEEVVEIDPINNTVTLSDGTIVQMDGVSVINIDADLVVCDGDVCQDEE